MNTVDLTKLLHSAFGTRASVRARRPDRLYQINIPAFLSDGDAPSIFVEPGEGDRIRMSDQGMTTMRLSYGASMSEASLRSLEGLAGRHGFRVAEGSITADIRPDEILAGAFGLLQIEAEAEATITAALARAKHSSRFREMIREILKSAFGGNCEIDYHAPDDPEGIFSIDARIAPAAASGSELLVAVTPNEIEAERAVAAMLHISRSRLAAGPSVTKARAHWIAIPRDVNDLEGRTRLRLMEEYLVPVPRYEEAEKLEKKLRELCA